MNIDDPDLLAAYVFAALFLGVAGLLFDGKRTRMSRYRLQKKPRWAPPVPLLFVMWTVLYVCSAVAAYQIHSTGKTTGDASRVKWPLITYAGSHLLLACYSTGARNLAVALVIAVLAFFGFAATSRQFYHLSDTAGVLVMWMPAWIAVMIALTGSMLARSAHKHVHAMARNQSSADKTHSARHKRHGNKESV